MLLDIRSNKCNWGNDIQQMKDSAGEMYTSLSEINITK